ncbi:MAG: leucine-rich repeat protein [Christensenellales bacterium]|jgi:hypothetical protein
MKRNLRRILSLALLALLLVSAVYAPLSPAVAHADDVFVIDNGVLKKYNGPGGNVRIPKGITEIGENAFKDCFGLKTVAIPKGVTRIGNNAFENCVNLKKATIPRGVTTIGDYAFNRCAGLRTVTIPKSVTKIGDSAFDNCSNLKAVTIPKGVEKIGRGTFGNCKSLTRISVPKGVTEIGSWAFVGCERLTRISIPEGVTKIGWAAFEGCGLTRISIPGTVKTIGSGAFACCIRLARVDMGSGVETIEDSAFMGCTALTDVELPNSLRTIWPFAFAECTALGSITIPGSVEWIGDGAFCRCPNLRVATVPKDMDDEEDMLAHAFQGGLTEFLYLPDDLLPPAIFLKVGQAMALPKFKGAKVAWRIEGEAVATVGRGNRIRGVQAGTADLKMTVQAAKGKALTLNGRPLKPGETYTIKLQVFGKKEPTARKVTVVQPKKPVLHPLGIDYPKTEKIELAFTPAALNADDDWKGNCFYISGNPKVAQVRSDGTIIAIKPGKATITAYAPNMKTAKVSVTVKGLITDLKLKNEGGDYVDKLTLNLNIWENPRLIPEFNADAAYTALRWSSSKPAVVAVTGFGRVIALSKGTAKITATAMDGSRKKATVTVTVTEPPETP